MARWSLPTDVIPPDLRTFVLERWVQDAIDADDPYMRSYSPSDVRRSKYVARIVATAHYREALRLAVGQRAGDHHFYQVLDVPRQAARESDSFEVI